MEVSAILQNRKCYRDNHFPRFWARDLYLRRMLQFVRSVGY